jgi:hypothetical protein
MYCKETSLGFKVSSNHADAETFVKLVEAGSRHPRYIAPPPKKKDEVYDHILKNLK